MAKRRKKRKSSTKSNCAGRKANGAVKKGYRIKKGHSCPVKA